MTFARIAGRDKTLKLLFLFFVTLNCCNNLLQKKNERLSLHVSCERTKNTAVLSLYAFECMTLKFENFNVMLPMPLHG